MTSQLPDPVRLVQEAGREWVPEVLALRQLALPRASASPQAFADALLEARGRLDRVEELLGSALALAGEYRRKAQALAEHAQEAWDREITGLPPGHRLKAEFVGAKELAAHCNLATLQQRREASQWKQAADLASDLVERIKLAHRGLDSARLDIHKKLSHFSLESSLDR